ncbi:MAG TPA: alpha/beta hydrolase [Polyangium sp.]|nr:alpha/beta hydrolase [Polyangium sp.]
MQFAKTKDGIKVAYRKHGEGSRVVIFVHGWTMSGQVYDGLLEQLDRSGLTLLVLDLRGAGGSDKPEAADAYSFAHYAADVLAVADAEKVAKFVVIGHSMGGQIAQWLAAHHSERVAGAVLLCPVPACGVPLPSELATLFSTSGGNRDAIKTILGMACKDLPEGAGEQLIDIAMGTTQNAVKFGFNTWTTGGFTDVLEKIRVPVVCVGTDDPFLPPPFLRGEVVGKIPGARFAYLPGAGHYVQVERPRETAAVVEAFLAALAL